MKSIHLSNISLIFLRPKPLASTTISLLLHATPKLPRTLFSVKPSARTFSTTATQYPLQYDMIISRPDQSASPSQPRRRPRELTQSRLTDGSPDSGPDTELGFDDWVDRKLTSRNSEMDKSQRKYYNKKRQRMYGSDSDDDSRRRDDEGFVELKPEVVEFRTLHKREEELYFHDTFAYPWEKDKHYKMVYQLEKKYFPDQCFDKAFLEPGKSNANANPKADRVKKIVGKSGERKENPKDDKGLVFFEDAEEGNDDRDKAPVKDVRVDVSEKKVGEFFKCLKKVPNQDAEVPNPEPFVSTRSTGLPPKWESLNGTVVLVNKPKGD